MRDKWPVGHFSGSLSFSHVDRCRVQVGFDFFSKIWDAHAVYRNDSREKLGNGVLATQQILCRHSGKILGHKIPNSFNLITSVFDDSHELTEGILLIILAAHEFLIL